MTLVEASPAVDTMATDERQHLVALARRWGGCASAAALDPLCRSFAIDAVDGVIRYRDEESCLIVFGDPLCAPHAIDALTAAFHSHAAASAKHVIYIGASQRFAVWAMEHQCEALIQFGEEMVLDPHYDPRDCTGVYGSLVRRKVRHAIKEGVTIDEYLLPDRGLEQRMEAVGAAWLAQRKGPQIHISHVRLFEERYGKRWLYALHGDKVVGVLVLNLVQTHHGWLLNHLMITPDAPHGTPELLVVSALETLRREGCYYVTLGIVPSQSLGDVVGFGPFYGWLTRAAYFVARRYFRLGGTRAFWKKFNPHAKPAYLLFSSNTVGLRELQSLMRGLNASS